MSDLAELFARALSMAREHLLLFAVAVALSTAMNAAIELAPESDFWVLMILFILVGIVLQAIVNASALGLDPIRSVSNRLVSIIGRGLLATVGLMGGLLFLVIPGLVLLLRWSISLPILLIEEQGAYESLQRSWELTASRWKIAMSIPAVFTLAVLPPSMLSWFTNYPAVPVPFVLAVNFYGSLLIVFTYFLGVALYRRIRGEILDTSLPEIFS